jgi:hypothetical protein
MVRRGRSKDTGKDTELKAEVIEDCNFGFRNNKPANRKVIYEFCMNQW